MSTQAFHDRDGWIWMNGEFVPWRDAKVHVLTHGLHYASSVFEGERAYDGVVFEGHRHSERLHRSAKMLGFEIPFSADELDAAKLETMSKMGLENCYVRPVAWRGSEMMGVSAQQNKINVAIACWEWPGYYADKMKGIKLTLSPWRRPAPDTIPCMAKAAGLYMICTLSKHWAEQEGYGDALMLDYRGYVAEATSANVFFVRDGAIHTPTPDCFLNGLTRQTVIRLAKARGLEVIERHIMPTELPTFSECFLTGTAAELTPVASILEHKYKPAAITEQLIDDYTNATKPGKNRGKNA
jgi:branched-chain amino acid aminotransferase